MPYFVFIYFFKHYIKSSVAHTGAAIKQYRVFHRRVTVSSYVPVLCWRGPAVPPRVPPFPLLAPQRLIVSVSARGQLSPGLSLRRSRCITETRIPPDGGLGLLLFSQGAVPLARPIFNIKKHLIKTKIDSLFRKVIIDSAMFGKGKCVVFLWCFVRWGRQTEHRLKMVDADREDWALGDGR